MAKDLNLAVNALHSTGVAARVGPLAAEIYDTFAAEGGAARDFSAIITDIRNRSDSLENGADVAASGTPAAGLPSQESPASQAPHQAAQDDGSPE
jgi:3-hydroxyisobutyrate dehydrogenase